MKASERCSCLVRSVSVTILCLFLANGYAGDVYWTNSNGGSFSDGSNWSTGSAPGTEDTACFKESGNYTVSWTTSITNSAASFELDSGKITLDIGMGNEYYLANEIHLQSTTGQAEVDMISGLVNLRTHLYIGDKSTSSGNNMTIRNPGTELRTRVYDIDVGRSGSNNELLVKDGAKLLSARAIYSGYGVGTNNLVCISGIDTVLECLENGGIIVGRDSDFNRFIIEESAEAYCTNNGTIYVGYNEDADNNELIVSSGGSIDIEDMCCVGYYGNDNIMSVTDGASLKSSSNILVGDRNTGNSLNVIDGGSIVAKSHLYLGHNSGGSSNSVLICGTGSVVSNYQYDINVGNFGDYNCMLVTNGGLLSAYRTLYVGTQTGSHNELVANGSNCLVEVKGLNYSKNNVVVGYDGVGNGFRLEDGAKLIASNTLPLIIGKNSSSSNNSFSVRSGSIATNGGNVFVGYAGSHNSMDIDDAMFNSELYMYVGFLSSDNTLSISNGGVYTGKGHIFIGYDIDASFNSVYVNGKESRLFNKLFDLDVGKSGSYNLLEISDGGEVEIARDIYVGHHISSSNNVLKVENAGLINANQDSDMFIDHSSMMEIAGSESIVQAYNLNIGTNSTLKLEIGESGFNPIEVGNRLSVDTTAKLCVDASAFAKRGGGVINLLNYQYKTGEFLEENMILIPEGCEINQNDDGCITLDVPSTAGTVLIVY